MAKGIDIGTAFIGVAELVSDEIIVKIMRDGFFEIEATHFFESMMNQAKVKYIKKGNLLYVVGDEAIEFASVFNKSARRPLAKGVLNPQDKEALPIMRILLDRLIGKGSGLAYFSIPSKPVDADYDIGYHEGMFKKLITELGYTSESINEGLAVIYSELESENFTGIGISCGAGLINVCFAYMSIPVFSFSVSRAGDWCDEEVSRATNTPTSRVCLAKERNLVLNEPTDDRILVALQIVYENLFTYVIKHIRQQFSLAESLPNITRSIPIIVAGGTSMPKGFEELFLKIWNTIEFPIEISEIRRCTEPLHAVAKGALRVALAKEM